MPWLRLAVFSAPAFLRSLAERPAAAQQPDSRPPILANQLRRRRAEPGLRSRATRESPPAAGWRSIDRAIGRTQFRALQHRRDPDSAERDWRDDFARGRSSAVALPPGILLRTDPVPGFPLSASAGLMDFAPHLACTTSTCVSSAAPTRRIWRARSESRG